MKLTEVMYKRKKSFVNMPLNYHVQLFFSLKINPDITKHKLPKQTVGVSESLSVERLAEKHIIKSLTDCFN